jgi:hypothetical protein
LTEEILMILNTIGQKKEALRTGEAKKTEEKAENFA